uniref:Claudin-15-like n=1 Tax=Sinocyclocheilus grahami TaxID=75366 RepID=A0A672SRF1_SINGR
MIFLLLLLVVKYDLDLIVWYFDIYTLRNKRYKKLKGTFSSKWYIFVMLVCVSDVMCFVGYIQACRALMIIALILGLLAVIMAAMGLKCTKLGSTSEESKGKISLTAGVMFMLSGLCVMVAVSWYAARVVQEFNDPFYGGTKYELGAGLYLGWAAAALAILGGAILCTSFKSSRPAKTRGHNYNYSASQPQKIYRSAPSENSVSKAYV